MPSWRCRRPSRSTCARCCTASIDDLPATCFERRYAQLVLDIAGAAALARRRFVVKGHEARLGRVITNLLDNAISFSPEGGTITVTRPQRVGPEIEIVVDDEGPGIPAGQARGHLQALLLGPAADRQHRRQELGPGPEHLARDRQRLRRPHLGRATACCRRGAEAGAARRSARAEGPARARRCRRPLHRPAAGRRCRTSQGSAARLPDAPELVHGTCVALGPRGRAAAGPVRVRQVRSRAALPVPGAARPRRPRAPILVADDQVELVRDGDRLLAAAPATHPRQDGGARRRHRRASSTLAQARAGAGRGPGAAERRSSACPTPTPRRACWASTCRCCGCARWEASAPIKLRPGAGAREPHLTDLVCCGQAASFRLPRRGGPEPSCARLGQAAAATGKRALTGTPPQKDAATSHDRRRHCRSWGLAGEFRAALEHVVGPQEQLEAFCRSAPTTTWRRGAWS